MPEGFEQTDEAELHSAPRLISEIDGRQLQDWWLSLFRGATKTPNWDIASSCTVRVGAEEKSGLLLVEAKAHNEELNREEAGKRWNEGDASEGSRRNHDRIGEAILSAKDGLSRDTSLQWKISRDNRYQMSNRFAWSWKLTQLGFPVILVYLGFLCAEEMRVGTNQRPFVDHADWAKLVKTHSGPLFPEAVWDRSWITNGEPFVPLIRSEVRPHDGPAEEATSTAPQRR